MFRVFEVDKFPFDDWKEKARVCGSSTFIRDKK
jgi:hypothetical protein